MSTPINIEASVAQLVIDRPQLGAVFGQLGIDYCCGGQRSLREACAEKGLDAATVALTLQAVGAMPVGDGVFTDWTKVSLSELCDHIQQTHHQYLRDKLPQLQAMVDTIARVHGSHHESLYEVQRIFTAMRTDLMEHTEKEDGTVFPLIRSLDGNEPGSGVTAAIVELESEHDATGERLAALRSLTDGYVAPDDACGTYRATLAGLEALEGETHQHIHKENNILFPRAIEKAKAINV